MRDEKWLAETTKQIRRNIEKMLPPDIKRGSSYKIIDADKRGYIGDGYVGDTIMINNVILGLSRSGEYPTVTGIPVGSSCVGAEAILERDDAVKCLEDTLKLVRDGKLETRAVGIKKTIAAQAKRRKVSAIAKGNNPRIK